MERIKRGIIRIIQDPRCIIYYMNSLGWFNCISDKKCVKLLWWSKTGKLLNLEKPKGFNEKMQWLKVYDQRPEYTNLVDKYLVRDFVRKKIGEQYLIPLLGVWNNSDEIDFSSLPNSFVLKCNHNSGEGMCICKDKSKLDIYKTKLNLDKELKKNFFYECREWPYKNISPKIIGEKLIVDKNPNNTIGTLIDYKFYCFSGEPKFLYVGADDISEGTKGELQLSFYDLNWKLAPFYRSDHKPFPQQLDAPECLRKMIEIARILSEGIPFVRVDLYWVNNQIYFSEMTFFPGGGYGFFYPEKWELKLGDWISLPLESSKPLQYS